MGAIYYLINNNDFNNFGISVISQSGLREPLEMKERISVDNISQNGVLLDRSGIRFKERKIELELQCFAASLADSENSFFNFLNEFYKSYPSRLLILGLDNVMVFDVDLLSWEESQYNQRCFTKKITLIETAPIKRVYEVTDSTASFTTAPLSGATQQPLLISWGDGNFDIVRTGTHTHSYSGSATRYVIISGVVDEVTITTQHTLKYSVLR